jgi:hypothetical protein
LFFISLTNGSLIFKLPFFSVMMILFCHSERSEESRGGGEDVFPGTT